MSRNNIVNRYQYPKEVFNQTSLTTEMNFIKSTDEAREKQFLANIRLSAVSAKAIQNRNASELKKVLEEKQCHFRNMILNKMKEENGLSLLHLACRANFEEGVKILLNNGADVSIQDTEGRQAIHYATKFYKTKILKNSSFCNLTNTKNESLCKKNCLALLIQNKADVNARDHYQSTPLHYACAKGHLAAVELCLNCKNVDLEALDDHQSTLIHEAAKNGHHQVVDMLIARCTKQNLHILEKKDVAGSTPLMYSCKNGYIKIVESILRASNTFTPGGSLLQMLNRDLQGNTLLHEAIEGGYTDVVKLLLEAWEKDSDYFQKSYGRSITDGNYLDQKRNDGSTALHLAAVHGDAEILKVLLNYEFSIDSTNDKNETAIFIATTNNHLSCVHLLLSKKCNIETRNCQRLTPFLASCENNFHRITKILIDAGADVMATDFKSRNCFIVSAKNGNDEVLQLLFDDLMECAELMNECDDVGNTALHEASASGHLSTVKLLVEKGIPLSVSNDGQKTPLHTAAAANRVDVVKFIVEKEKARLNDVDDCSRTALYFASSMGNIETVKALLKLGAKTNIRCEVINNMRQRGCVGTNSTLMATMTNRIDTKWWNALHVCAWKGMYKCAEILLKANPSLACTKTSKNETPLHLACSSGEHKVVRLLLSWQCDVTVRQQDGRNALDVAIDGSHEKCVRLLLEDKSWKQSLRNVTAGTKEGFISTPFRKMIKKMPSLVEIVLTKSISTNDVELHDKSLEVSFNFEFIEDMYTCVSWNGSEKVLNTEKPGALHTIANEYNITKFSTEDNQFSNDHNTPENNFRGAYSKSSSVLYQNHPLKLMADTKSESLLLHPTVTSLLSRKWKKYGQKLYMCNMLTYLLYLGFLNYYVLSTPPRFAVNETSTATSVGQGQRCVRIIAEEVEVWGYGCQDYTGARYVAVNLVIAFSAIQLFKEVIQLIHLRLSYFLEYTNYIEIVLYSLSIAVFYDSDPLVHLTGLRTRLQWEALSFVILFAWVNLLLYIRRSPLGLYVIMIENVGKSFIKFGLIVMFFLVGFSGSFYVLLQNQFVFDDPIKTWVKTLVMMTGEYDYGDIFLSHFTSDSYQDSVFYQTTAYFIFVIFVLSMGLLISNLLVGIAVDDISAVQNQATVKRLALQVDSVLNLEYALPSFIHRRMVALKHKIKPNKMKRSYIAEWVLSEEYVNLDEYLGKLKQKRNEKNGSNEKFNPSFFESVQSTLSDILCMQRKLEKQMKSLKIEMSKLKQEK